MAIRLRINELMLQHGMRRGRQLSLASGISENTVSRILRSEPDSMKLRTIEKLCLAFNCDVGELLVIERDEKPPVEA